MIPLNLAEERFTPYSNNVNHLKYNTKKCLFFPCGMEQRLLWLLFDNGAVNSDVVWWNAVILLSTEVITADKQKSKVQYMYLMP